MPDWSGNNKIEDKSEQRVARARGGKKCNLGQITESSIDNSVVSAAGLRLCDFHK